MSMRPPIGPPTLAAGSGTGLTGDYRVKQSFTVKNAGGQLLAESPLSPASLAVTLANDDLVISNIAVPTDSWVTGRRLYRTVADDDEEYFQMLDIDDIVSTTVTTSLPDSSLSLLPASPDLGNPPGSIQGTSLTNIIAWKGYLWGVPGAAEIRDFLERSELNQFYAWPGTRFEAAPAGEDSFGITGLMARRDELGFAKRGRLYKIIGSTDDDFQVVIVGEKLGCLAPFSVVVIRDKAYYLGLDGVYRWDDEGAVCISRATVDPWFTTDTYFNRALFSQAFAGYDPLANAYELVLPAAGGATFNRVVKFFIDKGEWLGPDSTTAFTPSCRAELNDADSRPLVATGATDGYIYLANQTNSRDVAGGSATQSAIASRADTKIHSGRDPDIVHFWGQLSVFSRVESSSVTMTVQPYKGKAADSLVGDPAILLDLTQGRERCRRIGAYDTNNQPANLMKLSFAQSAIGNRFLLFGYSVEPTFEVGRR
jgi:hypothetical protein